jgi:HAD superfamily hydrolase (TIGR01509 family)
MEIIREVYELNDSVSDMVEVIQRRAKVLLKTEAQAKPGAQEILCYVERQAIPCALVSNSTREIVEITIENQPWKHIFHAICPVEVAANPKPAPDLYLYAARQLGVSPSQCLAIEDSPSGAKAAVAAGTTCYVVQESHKHPVFADITPHHFSSLYEVLNLLQENG